MSLYHLRINSIYIYSPQSSWEPHSQGQVNNFSKEKNCGLNYRFMDLLYLKIKSLKPYHFNITNLRVLIIANLVKSQCNFIFLKNQFSSTNEKNKPRGHPFVVMV